MRTNDTPLTAAIHDRRPRCRLGQNGSVPVHYSAYSTPALSPDGRIVAVGKRDATTKQRDIWLLDTARGTETRLTLGPRGHMNPVWSPDGQMVAFTSDRKGPRALYVKPASGVKQEELILQQVAPG